MRKYFLLLLYILFVYLVAIYIVYNDSLSICIFGLALGIPLLSINIFLQSLEATRYKGSVILFLYNNTILNCYNFSFSFHTISIENKYPFYSKNNILYRLSNKHLLNCMIPDQKYRYKWNIYRFSLINCWLYKYFKYFNFYYILDVRDTIFQKNIENIKYKDILYLSEDAREPFKIKYDHANKKWINDYVKDSPIELFVPLNSGTIYGSQKYFKLFIHKYITFIKSKYINTAEQGTLNYLYYSNRLKNIPIIINKNENGIIYNMGIEVIYSTFYNNITYYIKNNILYRMPYNSVPYIVHQYDRDKMFLASLKNKYLNI